MDKKLRWTLLVLVLFSLLLHWRILPPEEFHDHKGNSDEYFYVAYAEHISKNGLSGFKDLVNWYDKSEDNRHHPSPLRAGYILLTVLFINLFGSSFSALVILSYICFLLFCRISYYFAKKNFSQDTAILFVLLLCASPLMLGMSRVALSESLTNLLLGTAAWLFLDFLQRPVRKTLLVLTLVLFFSMLVKETSCLFILFILIFSWISAKKFSIKIAPKDLAILVLVPPLLTIGFYWLLLGGKTFITALHGIYMTHFVDQANPYAIDFSSGPWYRYLVDFMLISPVMTTLALGYGFHLLVEKGKDWKKIYFLVYATVIFIPLSMLQHSKVVRFVINLEMVIALFCVFAVQALCQKSIEQKKFIQLVVFILVIFMFSYHQFITIFASPHLLDPITFNVLRIKEFIPYHR